MKKIHRKPHRYKRKKSIFRNRFFWLGILVLALMGITFYFLFLSPTFKVKEIKISGNQKVLTQDVKNIIENQLGQKILFFSSKSIFLVNLREINNVLLKEFPQIAKVNLERSFPNMLTVVIEERKPVAVFYQNENRFFIDDQGVIFDLLRDDISNKELLIKIRDKRGAGPFALGEKVIDREDLSGILETASKLKLGLEIPIKEFVIVSEERLNIKTLEGWEIYLNPKGDIAWQLTKLKAVLEEKIPQEKRKDLEYIELRFRNFASFKYRN